MTNHPINCPYLDPQILLIGYGSDGDQLTIDKGFLTESLLKGCSYIFCQLKLIFNFSYTLHL